MRKQLKRATPYILGVLLLCLMVWLVGSSQLFQSCISEGKNYAREEDLQNKVSILAGEFWVYRRCLGMYVIERNAAITALFTVALAGSTILLWLVTNKAAEAAKVAAEHIPAVERAFVKMSPCSPGLVLHDQDSTVHLRVSVKNYGRTPATVTDTMVKNMTLYRTELVPEIPDYSWDGERESSKAFLVADDEFFLMNIAPMSTNDRTHIANGEKKLFVFGYVDYIDQFGTRHRGGFARIYEPALDNRANYESDKHFTGRGNLIFMTKKGYDYDRPRRWGEGNDWQDSP
jgi:hypothetical protein